MKKNVVLLILLLYFPLIKADSEKLVFSKCIDGDTFKAYINGEEETIRLIAVNTPESVKKGTEVEPYGKESSEYVCNKLKKANNIVLEYDPKSDKEDLYDRLIGWIFVDGELLQCDLLEKGYAKTDYIYGKYKYLDELYVKEEEAKKKNIGIWSIEENDQSEETLMNEIKNTINKYLKELALDVWKEFKKIIKKFIKNIFS